MKQFLIKTAVGIVSFIAALILFGNLLNRGTTDLTVEMAKANLPVISFVSGNELYNPTFGYQSRRDTGLLKNTITPLGENRSIGFQIKTFGRKIDEIRLEVRTKTADRLIEDTVIKEFTKEGDCINVYTSLKDLLSEDGEYALTICLVMDGREYYYDARVEEREEVDVQTFLDFTHEFTDLSFGEKEEYSQLKKYLESNSSGDNTNFGFVNIHSSLDQVSWGNLEAKRESDFYTNLLTVQKDSASLMQYYFVQIGEGKDAEHYRVEEFFRIRRGTDRMHLLEYERTMSRLFFEGDDVFFGDTLYLGVDDGSVKTAESPEGSILAMVKDGALFVASPSGNRFARAFSYYDKSNYSERPMTELPEISVFTVGDDGRVVFSVSGYIPRGIHEGESGLVLYVFDLKRNTIEEKIFVPYNASTQLLKANVGNLLYCNSDGKFFFFLEGCIYRMDSETLETTVLAKGLSMEDFCINESGSMAAWVVSGDRRGADEILLENLETENLVTIKAGAGEKIMPKGFMRDDLVYGIARNEDISVDAFGNVNFPMYSVKIQTEEGTVFKEYALDGIYVTDCIFEGNMLTLSRVVKNEDGSFKETAPDTIVDNTPEQTFKNRLEMPVTENYETVCQLVLTGEFDEKTLQIMYPKMIIFEENRQFEVEKSEETYYLSFAKGRITGIWEDEADAVREAMANNGYVINNISDFIWEKKDYQLKNQIMAIKAAGIPAESSSLAVSLETLMQFEGFSQDADKDLAAGKSPVEIMRKYMSERNSLNLTGCSMDVIYYYLNRDIPVLVMFEDGSGVLLTGYNSGEIVWMNPAKESLYKVSKSESERIFEKNGNRFFTYTK